MDPTLLLKGLVMGFSIAAPVGPIGVLCIRRTLGDGILHGVVSGLGTASADAIYGCVAAFGVTAVSDFLLGSQFWLRLVGGLFLLYLGCATFRSVPAHEAARAGKVRSGEGRPQSTDSTRNGWASRSRSRFAQFARWMLTPRPSVM